MKKLSRIFFVLGLAATFLMNPTLATADNITEATSAREAIDALKVSRNDLLESTVEFYMSRGHECLDRQKYALAVQYLELAVCADPQYALAYYLLGDAYANVGRFDEARQAYIESKRLNPAYGIAGKLEDLEPEKLEARKQELASREVRSREYKKRERDSRREAAEIIRKILFSTPQSAESQTPDPADAVASPPLGAYSFIYLYHDPYRNLATMAPKGYLMLQPDGFYRWINNDPANPDNFDPLLTSGTYVWRDKGPGGRYRYDASSHEVRFLTGLLAQPGIVAKYGNRGTLPQIIITFLNTNDQAIEAPPTDWRGIFVDNRVFNAKSVREAVNILRNSQSRHSGEFSDFLPDDYANLTATPGTYTLHGLNYLKVKNYNNAIRELKAALNINPNFAPAHFLLGLAYIYAKDYNQARQSLDLAKQLNPYYAAEVEAASVLLLDVFQNEGDPLDEIPPDFKSPPSGIYTCTYANFTEETSGFFTLKSNGTYRWLNNGPICYYRYNPANKEVKFLNGPLAKSNITAKFGTDLLPRDDNQFQRTGIVVLSHTDDSRAGRALPLQWQYSWSQE